MSLNMKGRRSRHGKVRKRMATNYDPRNSQALCFNLTERARSEDLPSPSKARAAGSSQEKVVALSSEACR